MAGDYFKSGSDYMNVIETNQYMTGIILPSTLVTLGENAFYNCNNLASISIPNGVATIGGYAFYGCVNLTSVNIPSSVTSFGEWAFYGCTSLVSVTINHGVTAIGRMAFYDCDNLPSITIPGSVASIGDVAFANCYDLTKVIFMEDSNISDENFGSDVFIEHHNGSGGDGLKQAYLKTNHKSGIYIRRDNLGSYYYTWEKQE